MNIVSTEMPANLDYLESSRLCNSITLLITERQCHATTALPAGRSCCATSTARRLPPPPAPPGTDYMVWNVTRSEIKVRMAVVDEAIWPLPSITEKKSADPKDRYGFSDFINEGRGVYQEVIEKVYANT